MIDYQNLASSIDVQQFTGTDGVSWQTWYKPRNAMMVHILCIGAGAGGGSGRIDAGTVSTTGGSGGQPGCITSYYVPAFLIPDTLYMCPGLGGAGGASVSGAIATNGNNGIDGGISYVGIYPNIALRGNLLLQSSITTAGGGIGGVTGATYTVGLVPTPINLITSSSYYLSIGNFSSTNGTAATTNVLASSYTAMVSGGTCGGNIVSTNGVKRGANYDTSVQSIAPALAGGSASGGGKGLSGSSTKKPLFFSGGTGGGSSLTIGGDGGNGAYGCGGGGGGAAVTGASNRSGKGGDGGNGIIIITTY